MFKRDKFTCQYCGRSAPDVILNVDHIIPVSQDGTNNIMNFLGIYFTQVVLFSDDFLICDRL
ncbi:MAG: HNH endonuclease [Treponema sp.]|nr:HNH endonuclease [Treponema sp.]